MTKRAAHYTRRIAGEICNFIALGNSLEQALHKVGYLAPSMPMVWKWLDEHEEFREKYNRARTLQADRLADKTLEMVKDILADPRNVSAYRLAIDVFQYHAAVRNPKVYNKANALEGKPQPLDPTKIRAEIKRLEKELGVMEKKPELAVVKSLVPKVGNDE